MQRCIHLAKMAAGKTAPNPMVGAMLVHENRIIGEGYHQYYGGPHAEANCIGSVKEADRHLISEAVLYVSLEPCAHFGKTPPCADLIIENSIREVVVGCRDPFIEVNGKGIEKLRDAGTRVTTGVLEEKCRELNKRFFTFHTQHRPYILLKWAQTQNGKIAAPPNPPQSVDRDALHERLYISNEYTNRVVHKWRSEEASILVGTNTALLDDPALTNRYFPGNSPVRLVVDMDLELPSGLKIFTDGQAYTIIFNSKKHEINNLSSHAESQGIGFYQVTHDVSLVHQIVHALYQLNIQSVLVEGGARLLQSFIDEELWDEVRVITNSELQVPDGLSAPSLFNQRLIEEDAIMSDQIHYFANNSSIVNRTS
ncbi:MAG: bifunctional diaminohydroxyphosphoribosylaminopyrimidine deaminase/5-amino-6-(5-phosphoribosylamino)uracil reductase RibD [Chitinophagaceae bacterium]|nr:bifunctional diaminohydroxyphosphoribosylaminopyrimidine deaminase/5-amino-6-(5-phosphoribosylamino)uracil reductase RibD [Chitinophagaceae bacterium]